RKYLAVRLALLTVELSILFFAILAAISHGASHKGLSALVISSALALIVAGPILHAFRKVPYKIVMSVCVLLSALSGLSLVVNHYTRWVDITLIHAATLFLVTVAMVGASAARSLYYLDTAPKNQRVKGLAVSKSLIKSISVVIAIPMAAIAHMQHVTWAILIVSFLNVVAVACILTVLRKPAVAVD
ncbi:MAG: permease, partial [Pseudomonadota bacterium]